MIVTQKHTISLVVLASLFVFGSSSIAFGHDSEIGLLNYMARSNDLLQQDPTRSLNCFNKYIPLINQIANNYETSFKACLNKSETDRAQADENTLGQRNDLANAAEASCALLKQCQEDNSVEGIFQCYIDGGSANIQTMYIINANASQELASLREQYYLIRNDEYRCTNETKRIYEKESSAAYAGLNNCILGNSDIVTEQPSTTAASTTNAPAETTPETTSGEPETSDKPSTTTSAPASTAIVPEESTSESAAVTSDEPSETTENATTNESESTEIAPESSTTTSASESTAIVPEEPSETTENATSSDVYP